MSPGSLREFVRSRAEGRCEYCQLPELEELPPHHLEHIVARQHGGTDQPDNLAWACRRCNLFKGPNLTAIDPDSSEIVPLFHPRRDDWFVHFEVKASRIIGRTPADRATVVLLNMNDSRRLTLRDAIQAGAPAPPIPPSHS